MSQGGHFTIDFIEEEYRDQIKTLMDILCIDLKNAYELFMNSGCNLQDAINHSTGAVQHHDIAVNSHNVSRQSIKDKNNIKKPQKYRDQDSPEYFNHDFQDQDQFASLPRARRAPRIFGHHDFERVQQECQFDVKFNKFLQFNQKRKNFTKNYNIRREMTTGNSISAQLFGKKPKHQKKQLLNLNPYDKQLQRNFLSKRCYIKFGQGSMSQNLQSCWKHDKPLILYHLALDKENQKVEKVQQKQQKQQKLQKQQNKLLRNNRRKVANGNKKQFKAPQVIDITQQNSNDKIIILDDEKQQINQGQKYKKTHKNRYLEQLLNSDRIRSYVNQAFLNYIFDIESYQLEPYFKELFPKNKQVLGSSYLTIIRVNIYHEFEVVGKVDLDGIIKKIQTEKQSKKQQELSEFINEILNQLKLLKQKVIKDLDEQKRLRQRYNYYRQGIFNYEYDKPLTTTQKKKIKQDQQIIKQQQAEFFDVVNQLRQQKMKEIIQQQKQKQQNKQMSKDQLLGKRNQIYQKLKQYQEGQQKIMTIKFRLPSGKNIFLNVSNSQTVQYLFDYIYSHPIQNMGFEEEQQKGYCERKFDIIRPGDRLSLQDKIQIKLQAIFEGSLMESLVVKEK